MERHANYMHVIISIQRINTSELAVLLIKLHIHRISSPYETYCDELCITDARTVK